MTQKVLLKKYANRRLYDTEKSSYVTLNQIADMIRDGKYVKVVDAKTQEDVTSFTLTQIVLEESKNKNGLLPIPLLHMIIQFGDNLLLEFFEKYLQQTLKNYLAYKTALDDQFKSWLNLGMNISDIAPKTLSEIKAFNAFMDFFYPEKKENEQTKE